MPANAERSGGLCCISDLHIFQSSVEGLKTLGRRGAWKSVFGWGNVCEHEKMQNAESVIMIMQILSSEKKCKNCNGEGCRQK